MFAGYLQYKFYKFACNFRKGFGASLVKKVRKASSDIISKVPRGRSRNRNATDEADTSVNSTTRETDHSSDGTMSDEGSALPIDSDTDTSLSTVGTRRAIYYDDHPSSSIRVSFFCLSLFNFFNQY